MKFTKLRMTLTVLLTLLITVAAAGAATIACHAYYKPKCFGLFTIFNADLKYEMSGSKALANVDSFRNPATTRKVTWKSIAMTGTIGTDTAITATLDSRHKSTGTVLSVGRREFPATATMNFYFRIKTRGMELVSDSPAVFQGTVHSIPPAAGDTLTLTNGPVAFHSDAEPGKAIGTMKESAVSFRAPRPRPHPRPVPHRQG